MHSDTFRTIGAVAVAASTALLLAACGSGNGNSTSSSGSGTSSPPTAAAAAPTPSAAAAASCQNLVANAGVKAAVTKAFTAESKQVHVAPKAGTFLYGECGGTRFAAVAFVPTTGATEQEGVAAQDQGSVRKYFTAAGSGSWSYLGSAGFPDKGGCLAKLPQNLAQLWGGCPTA